ncbi:hypothetical protein AURDEDRAFT_182228 [Auricularia subglabra TFB-10046 SS5]|nr:hypothetical protein AURDEDRAFT_182228 [Auricularia subglabra TFB-10046 SS5]
MATRSVALSLPYEAWEPIVEALKEGDQLQDTQDFTRDVGSLSATCRLMRKHLGLFLYREILLRGPHAKSPTERDYWLEWHGFLATEYTLAQLQGRPSIHSMVDRVTLLHWMCHVQFSAEQLHLAHQQTLVTIWSLLPKLHNLAYLGLIAVAVTSEGHDVLRQLASVRELVLDRCSIWPCTEQALAQASLLRLESLLLRDMKWNESQQPSSFANSSRLRRLETDSVPLVHAIYNQLKYARDPAHLSELVIPSYMSLGEPLPGISSPGDIPGLVASLLAFCPGLVRLQLPDGVSPPMFRMCPKLQHLTAAVALATDAVSLRALAEINAVEDDHPGPQTMSTLTALVAAMREHNPTATTSFMYIGNMNLDYASVVHTCAAILPNLTKFGISSLQMSGTVDNVFQAARGHAAELARVQELHFSYVMPKIATEDVAALVSLCIDLQPVCPDLWKVGIGENIDCVLGDDGEWRVL